LFAAPAARDESQRDESLLFAAPAARDESQRDESLLFAAPAARDEKDGLGAEAQAPNLCSPF
jgi:hypothetical protein